MGSWWIGDLALNCYFQSWACETGTFGRSFYWFCFWCVGLMLDGSVIDASVDEMSCLWTWTAWTILWHLTICCMLSIWSKLKQCGLFSWFFSTPSGPGLQVVFYMAASLSKARARRIPRDVSSSDESSHEVLEDPNILPRQFSLMSPRMPRLHSIKGPFKLVLGGILVDPPRSRTRWTPFKLIERLPGQIGRASCRERV